MCLWLIWLRFTECRPIFDSSPFSSSYFRLLLLALFFDTGSLLTNCPFIVCPTAPKYAPKKNQQTNDQHFIIALITAFQ
uniref:Putative secreted protein n=1 Tax=Anopheles triannulatus TaxID=58253 RepID=A0A2M4B1H8_9DIPT